LLADQGLKRGENKLAIVMMCELPSNALLADQFLDYFDGFSIGSNDMTQLTLGLDRDSGGPIASKFDERDAAVKMMLSMAIAACRTRLAGPIAPCLSWRSRSCGRHGERSRDVAGPSAGDCCGRCRARVLGRQSHMGARSSAVTTRRPRTARRGRSHRRCNAG